MSDPYVTIGGKQVYPRAPAAAGQHAEQSGKDTVWQESWQRETTRISIPVGAILLMAGLVLITVKCIQRGRKRRTLAHS